MHLCIHSKVDRNHHSLEALLAIVYPGQYKRHTSLNRVNIKDNQKEASNVGKDYCKANNVEAKGPN